MTPLPDQLPDDIDQLKTMVIELVTALQGSERTNERLVHRLNQLLRSTYGRKSERLNPAQLQMFKEMVENAIAETGSEQKSAEQVSQEPEAPPVPKSGHGRNAIPEHLPRKDVIHDIADDQRHCTACGCELCLIGEEVSEQLDLIPSSLYVKRHIRKKYACKRCENTVVVADVPEKPIAKGLAGPGLLAHVMVSKYADHLPLHRLEKIFERQGISIPRSTMCGWVAACANLVQPLYDAMKAEVLKSRVINTDDTPVPVLDRDLTATRKGYIWVYLGDRDHPYTLYDYTPTRCREGPEAFLGDYRGYMQADAYSGYDRIYRIEHGEKKRDGAIEVGCWAHARRYFYDAQETSLVHATVALSFIHRLYKIERTAKVLDDDARKEMRQEQSAPILKAFLEWLETTGRSVLPKAPIGEAIGYALNQWKALNRYLEQGWLAFDNNFAEREIRPFAVGRKNWLFAGSDQGGQRAAVIASLTASARRHQVNPFAYLVDIFERLQTYRAADISDFFPDRWAKRQLSTVSAAAHAPQDVVASRS